MEEPKKIQVLVVEDHEDDYRYLSYLLRRAVFAEYELHWAISYEAGLEALRNRRFDVGLFDYMLGGGTGLDLLRDATLSGCEMPVILLTGNDSPEVDREALEAGAADYLCKVGLNVTQLERAIRYSLRQAAMLSVVRKSQKQLELFMHNVPCAVCIRREDDGEFIFKNDRFQTYFRDAPLQDVWSSETSREPKPYSDGSHHWLVSAFPMVGPQSGELQGLAAVEITERVRAEQLLLKTTGLLDGILKSLPVIAWSVDENGQILEARGRGLDAIGRRHDDLAGTTFMDFAPDVSEQISKALRKESVNFIWPIEHEGRTHYFDTYFHYDNARGQGALGFSINITARVEAEMACNRQSQLLRAIMRQLPVFAGRLDNEGRVIEAEGDGLTRLGMSPDSVMDRKIGDIYPQAQEPVQRALDGSSATFTISAQQDGNEWVAEFFVFYDAEQGSGALFFVRDITERRWLERKLLHISDSEQLRIGADLHDGLGQHLTGIACMAAALRDRLKALGIAETKQADAIAGLVNDAMAQTRALARGLCPVQLDQTGLQSALENLTCQIELLHAVKCRFNVHGRPFACGHDSAIHLYRITQEAIQNAIRHGEARSVQVSLESEAASQRLIIRDDGRGYNTRDLTNGPGVGLRLMGYRAAMIGGTFSIAALPGGGTRVECTFPAVPSTNEN